MLTKYSVSYQKLFKLINFWSSNTKFNNFLFFPFSRMIIQKVKVMVYLSALARTLIELLCCWFFFFSWDACKFYIEKSETCYLLSERRVFFHVPFTRPLMRGPKEEINWPTWIPMWKYKINKKILNAAKTTKRISEKMYLLKHVINGA